MTGSEKFGRELGGFMLCDGENGGNSLDAERPKELEEIIERISEKYFSKYSRREGEIMSKGRSALDVFQEKLIEFSRRIRNPAVDPQEEAGKIGWYIEKGIHKLRLHSNNTKSFDDENFDFKQLAQESRILTKLEKLEIIEKVLSGYDVRKQLVIDLRLFKEVSFKETAEKMNTTEGNVRQIISRFYEDCRKFGFELPKNKKCRGGNDGK